MSVVFTVSRPTQHQCDEMTCRSHSCHVECCATDQCVRSNFALSCDAAAAAAEPAPPKEKSGWLTLLSRKRRLMGSFKASWWAVKDGKLEYRKSPEKPILVSLELRKVRLLVLRVWC